MAKLDTEILEEVAVFCEGVAGQEVSMQAVLRALRELQERDGENLDIKTVCNELSILSKTAQLVRENLELELRRRTQ